MSNVKSKMLNDLNRPIQIVMTPIRNEAWVIRAFLECNGLWADYIIIADQMSTDGTREIVAEYQEKWNTLHSTPYTVHNTHQCQLIMIDNTNPEFNEAERQGMLVAKAREVAAGRDTLLWGLDADEILPVNWQETEDGKRILNSVKGDVFWFKWANIASDRVHYGDSVYYPWLFHDDGIEPHGNYVRNMHSMRIPYPIEEKQVHYVQDFRVLHCGLLDPKRLAAKGRFYLLVDWELNHKNPIALARRYGEHRIENQVMGKQFTLEPEVIAFPFDVWSLMEIGAKQTWFDDYIYERLPKYPMRQLRKLDIWDKEFMRCYHITDSRRLVDKMIHWYMHRTNKWSNTLLVRGIDKVLKMLYKA